MCFKNIQDLTPYFQNFTQFSSLSATFWFVYRLSLDFFICNCALFMCFLCASRISWTHIIFWKFTQISQQRVTLWFEHRPFLRYYRIKLWYIYVLLLQKFPRYNPCEFSANLGSAAFDIFWRVTKLNLYASCVLLKCARPKPLFQKISEILPFRTTLSLKSVFAISLNAIVQHSCGSYVLISKTQIPVLKIPQKILRCIVYYVTRGKKQRF